MSLNAATIEFLLAKGLTGEDLLEVARRSETRADPTAAERKRRQRDREAMSRRDVTRDTEPQKENPPNPLKKNNPPIKPKGLSPRRLPDDFVMPDDWKDWAREKRGWSQSDIGTEAENFTDYWQARGSGATKRDWRKAWQTWVRNSKRADGQHRNTKPLTEAERRAYAERMAALDAKLGRGPDGFIAPPRAHATGPPGQPIGARVAGIMKQAGAG